MRSSDAGDFRASVSVCDGPESIADVNSQVNASATSRSPVPLDEEEPEELPTPRKKRRTWPGADAELLCATAVPTVGAHLAEWGRGEQMYERAAEVFNEQPRRPFETDGRTMKEHFCDMLRKFNKRDNVAESRSGVSETQTKVNSLLDEANSAIRDGTLLAAAAKGTQSKKDEALLRAGETVRRSAMNLRLARRAAGGEAVAITKGAAARGAAPAANRREGDRVGGGQRHAAAEDEGGSAADGGTEVPYEAPSPPEPSSSPAAARRRRRVHEEDEKDEAVFLNCWSAARASGMRRTKDTVRRRGSAWSSMSGAWSTSSVFKSSCQGSTLLKRRPESKPLRVQLPSPRPTERSEKRCWT